MLFSLVSIIFGWVDWINNIWRNKKMANLNKAKREQIIHNAVKASGVNKQVEELIKQRSDFAEKIRLRGMGGQENINSFLNKAVPECFNSNTEVKFIFNTSERRSLSFCGRFPYSNSLVEYSSQPDYKSFPCPKGFFKLLESEEKEFSNLVMIEERLTALAKSITQTVKPIVNSVRTEKQLLTIWPEVAELLPTNKIEVKTQLPAIPVKEINALIGLPTKK